MVGREELEKLCAQKQALVVESGLNRLALQAEIQNLRSATTWMSEVTHVSRGLTPLMLILAPLAGFLFARGSRPTDSWVSRIVAAVRWLGPLYRLWKSFSASRDQQAEPGGPAD